MSINKQLICAAFEGNLTKIKHIHRSGGDDISESLGLVLSNAICCGHKEILRYIFENCDVTIGGDNDTLNASYVLSAARNGGREMIEYVLTFGTHVPINYMRILRATLWYKDLKMLKFIVEECNVPITSDDNYPIRSASASGDLEMVKYIHKKGGDIKVNDNVSIINAAYRRHLPTLKYLHENGADITTQDNKALLYSIRFGYDEIEKYINEVST